MTEISAQSGSLETPKDAGQGASGVYTRWMMELALSDRTEEDWRKAAQNVVELVRDEKGGKGRRGKVRYNIVSSNVATLKPALYAQSPRPDIRPRYPDADPINRQVAKVLERAVSYHLDTYDFDGAMKSAVHDILVPGRAVSRVRYKPVMQTVTPDPVQVMESEDGGYLRGDTNEPVEEFDTAEDGAMSITPEPYEKKAYEETCVEHVHWDDFRRGPGRCWSEVTWVAFRHKLTKEECVDKFGEDKASNITLDYEPDGVSGKKDKDANPDTFKRAIVWEIWCKDDRTVYWIASSYKNGPVKTEEDPLDLEGFFPIPAPVYALSDPDSLVPVEDYRLYKDQAEELDIITRRISIITAGLKFRGIYDGNIKEINDLMKGEDNEFLPATNVTQLVKDGGLERALFFLPIDMAAQVLRQLYMQRGEVKQEIYEISGVADIMRGSSNAGETLGAQKIKAQWGTQRLQDRQRDVQAHARALIRILAEIISEKYDPMTLKLMTGLEVTPEMLQVMRLDGPRSFRIDIETDSTIAVDNEADQRNLAELTQGLGTLMASLGPLVQTGAMPMDAAKAIIMSLTRRFKLGREVEDTLDQIAQQSAQQAAQQGAQGPGQQPPNPQQQQAAAEAQRQQMEAQATQAETQARAQKAQAEAQSTQMRAQADQAQHEADMARIANQRQLDAQEHAAKMEELAMKRAEYSARNRQALLGVNQDAA